MGALNQSSLDSGIVDQQKGPQGADPRSALVYGSQGNRGQQRGREVSERYGARQPWCWCWCWRESLVNKGRPWVCGGLFVISSGF